MPVYIRDKSRDLRRFACNGFLMGITTGISGLPDDPKCNAFKSLVHDRLRPAWELINEIGIAENEKNAQDELFHRLWKKFFNLIKHMRWFLGPKSLIPKYWREVQRDSLLELKEAIILNFGPLEHH